MHTNKTPDDPDVLKEMGFDRRDIDGKQMTKWIVAFLALSVSFFLVGLPIYNLVAPQQARWGSGADKPFRDPSKLPKYPNPLLQDNATTKVDIMSMRQNELKTINATEWVDAKKEIVRIPVDRAIDLIAKRGVSTGLAVAAKSQGNTIKQNALEPTKP